MQHMHMHISRSDLTNIQVQSVVLYLVNVDLLCPAGRVR